MAMSPSSVPPQAERPPAASPEFMDRANPEAEIARAVRAYFEVRPSEFDEAFQRLHQMAIPHLGLLVGEMWALEELAADCAADGVYEFFLTAAPLPITGAVGSPVNPIAVK